MSLLTADHQTTGGYPRVAVVIDPDIDRVAQLPAGATIRLEMIDEAEAIAQARAAHRQTTQWLGRVKAGCRPPPPLMMANLVDGVVVTRPQGTKSPPQR